MEKMSFDEFMSLLENNAFTDIECVCPECKEEHVKKTLTKYITSKKTLLHKKLKKSVEAGERFEALCNKCYKKNEGK